MAYKTMWKSIVFFSLLLAYSEGAFEGPDIVNGTKVEGNDRPFQVSLQAMSGGENGLHFCGGSIISASYVITAAHCTIPYNESVIGYLSVAAGMLGRHHPGQTRKWASKHEHEECDPKNSYINDISIIKVEKPFKFNSMVKAVPLPKPHLFIPDNTSVVLSGWGYLGGDLPKTPVDDLREVTIYTVSQKRCKELIETPGSKSKVHKGNLCAYNPNFRAGQCTDDSGGPLTWNGVLVGLVSWSYKDPYCASTKRPGQYTRISEYLGWIKKNSNNAV